MPTSPNPVRERGFEDFGAVPPETRQQRQHWLMRAQNFSVEWVEFDRGAEDFRFHSEAESLMFCVRGRLRLRPEDGAMEATDLCADAIAVLPAGAYRVQAEPGAACALIASHRCDLTDRRMLNAYGYEQPDPRITHADGLWRRKTQGRRIQVLGFDEIMASPERPRLKMLQTETLSINLVDYQGPRDCTALSPHSHVNFEQGSLAIAGRFVHHLRTPWGVNANQWRDDEHLAAASPSLVVVPVNMIHTTEGVGEGRHVLIDVFSPPRADFIQSGWVFNAGDYEAAD